MGHAEWQSGTNDGLPSQVINNADELDRKTLKVIIDKSNNCGGGQGQGCGFSFNTLSISVQLDDGQWYVWHNSGRRQLGNGLPKRVEIPLN